MGLLGHLADDTGAADMAIVIIAIMAASTGGDSERYGRQPGLQAAEERDRSHP
jgi:hypothetical protein